MRAASKGKNSAVRDYYLSADALDENSTQPRELMPSSAFSLYVSLGAWVNEEDSYGD